MFNLLLTLSLDCLLFKKQQMKVMSITEITAEGTTIRTTVREVLLFFPAEPTYLEIPSLIIEFLIFSVEKVKNDTTYYFSFLFHIRIHYFPLYKWLIWKFLRFIICIQVTILKSLHLLMDCWVLMGAQVGLTQLNPTKLEIKEKWFMGVGTIKNGSKTI